MKFALIGATAVAGAAFATPGPAQAVRVHVRRSGANSLPFLRRRFRDDDFPQVSRFRHDARRRAASRTPRFLNALRRLRAPSLS